MKSTGRVGDGGFTVVELIIIIIVIGILATISVVSYSGAQARANRSSAESTVQQVKLKLGEHMTDKNTYPHDKAAVVAYLNTVNASATATAFNTAKNGQNISYTAQAAGGGACSAVITCVTYTITVPVAYWKGSASDSPITVTP